MDRKQGCSWAKSESGFLHGWKIAFWLNPTQIFGFFASIWCLNLRWFIGVYPGVSMMSPFIRKNTGPVFFWTPIFVPLMIWSQPENVTFDSDDWNWLLYNQLAHTQMCVPVLHICFPLRPSHTRALVELWFTGRSRMLLSGEGWFRTFQFISGAAFTHGGDSQRKFLVTLWCQWALWGRVGGTSNHTLESFERNMIT